VQTLPGRTLEHSLSYLAKLSLVAPSRFYLTGHTSAFLNHSAPVGWEFTIHSALQPDLWASRWTWRRRDASLRIYRLSFSLTRHTAGQFGPLVAFNCAYAVRRFLRDRGRLPWDCRRSSLYGLRWQFCRRGFLHRYPPANRWHFLRLWRVWILETLGGHGVGPLHLCCLPNIPAPTLTRYFHCPPRYLRLHLLSQWRRRDTFRLRARGKLLRRQIFDSSRR